MLPNRSSTLSLPNSRPQSRYPKIKQQHCVTSTVQQLPLQRTASLRKSNAEKSRELLRKSPLQVRAGKQPHHFLNAELQKLTPHQLLLEPI
jgi:hypothetical protein